MRQKFQGIEDQDTLVTCDAENASIPWNVVEPGRHIRRPEMIGAQSGVEFARSESDIRANTTDRGPSSVLTGQYSYQIG